MRPTFFLLLWTLVLTPAFSARGIQTPSLPNEQRWQSEHEAGQKAIEQGFYWQAVRLFQAAIEEAEKFGSDDLRLAQSINGKAQAYLLQGNPAAAERQFKLALAIYEKTAGPDDLNVAMVLNGLATLNRLRENYPEATALSRRALAILEKAYGPEHPNVAIAQNNLSMILRLHGDYDEARALSERSLSILEKALGPEHPNVAISLNNLVLVYTLQGNYAEAEPLARRSVSIFEKTPGAATSNLLQSLENLAQVCRELEKYDESEKLYRRVLTVRWGVGADVVPILERFAEMLNLAFSETPLKEAQEAFQAAPGWNGVPEELYVVMGRALRDRGLTAGPEEVLRRGTEAFPDSLQVRYELAEVFAEALRYQTALDILEGAANVKGSGDPGRDRYLRSRIYEEMSRMQTFLFQFDEALSNLKTASDLDPGNAQAFVDLGDLYLKLDKPEDAAEPYAQAVLLTGGNAAAYYGIAELNRRLGRYPQAVMAADKALEINPRDSKSSYIRAMALLQGDHPEEGEAELKRFDGLEADERGEVVRGRTIPAALHTAFTKLEEGQGEAAIKLLRGAIHSYPDSTALHLNLGILQSRLGMHGDAVKTFEDMIDRGDQDYFLVHFNLSREYESLGDMKASRLHWLTYLQKYDAFLINTRK